MTYNQHVSEANRYMTMIKSGNHSIAWETVLRNLCEEQILLAEIAKLKSLGV